MPDQPQPGSSTKDTLKKEIDKIPPTNDRNLMAALSYVWIICLIMLAIRRDEPFIKFHAKQALVLFIVSVIASILLWVPVLGIVVWVLSIVGMVLGFINAWQGKEYKLPFIYDWSNSWFKF